jgi:hypothetical protein
VSHNLIHNIIPGAIALAVILGGILWLIVDDVRRQNGRTTSRTPIGTDTVKYMASVPDRVAQAQLGRSSAGTSSRSNGGVANTPSLSQSVRR